MFDRVLKNCSFSHWPTGAIRLFPLPKGENKPPCRRHEFLIRDLRIDRQADGRREGRSLGGWRQARHTHRATDTHVAGQNTARRLRQAGQLAGTARQHDPLAHDPAKIPRR